MGFENGGDTTYHCAICQVYLADKAAIKSTNFNGVTGQAYLFKTVSNVSYGSLTRREMMTGNHFVRDVFCGGCKEHIGWMYELAPSDQEKYKEGCTVLECSYIIESDMISDNDSVEDIEEDSEDDDLRVETLPTDFSTKVGLHGVVDSRGDLYGCRACLTDITSAEERSSTVFNGSSGPATLFKRAWNVTHGDLRNREMTTGMHIIRDVHCGSCKKKLGWKYELALVNSQIYKEGQVILENAFMCRISLDMKDPAGEEPGVPVPPNIEASRHRKSSEKKTRSNSESGSSSSSSSSDFTKTH